MRASYSDLRNITRVDPNVQFGDGWYYSGTPQGAVRRNGDGKVQTAYKAYFCEIGASNSVGDIQWRDEPTVDDLIPLVPEEAERVIQLPEIFVNPPRGFVNVGMWLATPNSEPIPLELGDFTTGPWIRAEAKVTETVWNMGDGSRDFPCDGPGVVLERGDPGWDSIDKGPCGYIYKQHTPGDETYTITVTARWDVEWNASDGREGTAGPIFRTNTLEYDVDEIQTVGEAG